jgi:hypothetical protein
MRMRMMMQLRATKKVLGIMRAQMRVMIERSRGRMVGLQLMKPFMVMNRKRMQLRSLVDMCQRVTT